MFDYFNHSGGESRQPPVPEMKTRAIATIINDEAN
jgi:hypothetical protein